MKPDNQTVMDGVMKNVRELTLTQRRTFLRAMSNPYFFLFAFLLARADANETRRAYEFFCTLRGDGKKVNT